MFISCGRPTYQFSPKKIRVITCNFQSLASPTERDLRRFYLFRGNGKSPEKDYLVVQGS